MAEMQINRGDKVAFAIPSTTPFHAGATFIVIRNVMALYHDGTPAEPKVLMRAQNTDAAGGYAFVVASEADLRLVEEGPAGARLAEVRL